MAKGTETRARLIQAATDLFYEKGVQWVSFQQIASAVGLTNAALYKHFADKDDLLQACALSAAQSGRQIIDRNLNETQSAKQRLYSYIEGNLLWLNERPKEGLIVLSLYYFGFNSAPIQKLLVSINSQSISRIRARLAEGNREKSWKVIDTERSARAVHDLMLGEMIKAVHQPHEMKIEYRVEFLWENVASIINTKS
jgi:AcrR family transcriptional regulator